MTAISGMLELTANDATSPRRPQWTAELANWAVLGVVFVVAAILFGCIAASRAH